MPLRRHGPRTWAKHVDLNGQAGSQRGSGLGSQFTDLAPVIDDFATDFFSASHTTEVSGTPFARRREIATVAVKNHGLVVVGPLSMTLTPNRLQVSAGFGFASRRPLNPRDVLFDWVAATAQCLACQS